jgi:hypothetical protein
LHAGDELLRSPGDLGSWRVEYRHVYSQSGGAQFGLASVPDEDLLTVYAEAFERDADPEEFSLEAIIAHECGHQQIARNLRLIRNLPRTWSEGSEEIVASLIGSLLVENEKDQLALFFKAHYEADMLGLEPHHAEVLIDELLHLLERML